jgi:hypothetical protein
MKKQKLDITPISVGDSVFSRKLGVPSIGTVQLILRLEDFQRLLSEKEESLQKFKGHFAMWANFYTINIKTDIALVRFDTPIVGVAKDVFDRTFGKGLDLEEYKNLVEARDVWPYPVEDLEKLENAFN